MIKKPENTKTSKYILRIFNTLSWQHPPPSNFYDIQYNSQNLIILLQFIIKWCFLNTIQETRMSILKAPP